MSHPYNLTTEEVQILHWSSLGKTQSETGQILGMTRAAVGMTLHRIYNKMSANNIQGAIGIALRAGIIE